MTSLKQITANRTNALKSTGPRSEQGKLRSRQNAMRHGLAAETVVAVLENAADYEKFAASIAADYQPRSATESELVARLASLLWRLRRSTSVETGLFQIQGELMRNGNSGARRRNVVPLPEWYDELDTAPRVTRFCEVDVAGQNDSQSTASTQSLAYCFLRVSRLGCGALELLNRYETALWRQVAQLVYLLQAIVRQ
jgi:hypothetical protein